MSNDDLVTSSGCCLWQGLARWRVIVISPSAGHQVRTGGVKKQDQIRSESSSWGLCLKCLCNQDWQVLRAVTESEGGKWKRLDWSRRVPAQMHVLLSPLISELTKLLSSCWFVKMFSCKHLLDRHKDVCSVSVCSLSQSLRKCQEAAAIKELQWERCHFLIWVSGNGAAALMDIKVCPAKTHVRKKKNIMLLCKEQESSYSNKLVKCTFLILSN